jgi:hypothetical protein
MKKIIFGVFLIIAVSFLLVGCGKKETSPTPTQSSQDTTVPPTPASNNDVSNEINNNINDINQIEQDLNESDVNNTENDLNQINW